MYGMCAGARSVVVEAYAKYGMPGKVADALNSRGYVNRIGKKWRRQTVISLIAWGVTDTVLSQVSKVLKAHPLPPETLRAGANARSKGIATSQRKASEAIGIASKCRRACGRRRRGGGGRYGQSPSKANGAKRAGSSWDSDRVRPRKKLKLLPVYTSSGAVVVSVATI